MPNPERETVLAIFAHPDDELGVAGTLANHADKGDRVVLLWLTQGENSSTVQGKSRNEIKEIRRKHGEEIGSILGCETRFLDMPDSAVRPTHENALKVAEVLREVRPTIVITWSKYFTVGGGHPDHRYCFDIVLDAFSLARYKNDHSEYGPLRSQISLYTYPDPFDRFEKVYVDVSHQMERIHRFLEVYKEAYGPWPAEEFKKARLLDAGRRANVKYAEEFSVIQTKAPAGLYLK